MARSPLWRVRTVGLLACAFALVSVAAAVYEHPHDPGSTTARAAALTAGGLPAGPAVSTAPPTLGMPGLGTGHGRSASGPVDAPPGTASFPAAVAGRAIGPGTVTETPGAGICTAGFVFTGGGRTFLGQAAHCAGTGPETETDGCTSSTLRPGVPVTVRGPGGPVTGTLRYSSWTAMQDRGEVDPDVCAFNDFALVELPGVPVSPSVPVLGGPGGIRDAPASPGTPAFGLATPSSPTVRPGSTGSDDGGGWAHTVRTAKPGAPGDSGGPLVDERGLALGVLSGMERDGTLEYTDLARAVDWARRHGAPPDLALLPGTTPFTPPAR